MWFSVGEHCDSLPGIQSALIESAGMEREWITSGEVTVNSVGWCTGKAAIEAVMARRGNPK